MLIMSIYLIRCKKSGWSFCTPVWSNTFSICVRYYRYMIIFASYFHIRDAEYTVGWKYRIHSYSRILAFYRWILTILSAWVWELYGLDIPWRRHSKYDTCSTWPIKSKMTSFLFNTACDNKRLWNLWAHQQLKLLQVFRFQTWNSPFHLGYIFLHKQVI
jgi:hypothetical protein